MELSAQHYDLVHGMLREQAVKFGGKHTLKDGRESSFYVNTRDLISAPDLFIDAVHALGNVAFTRYFDEPEQASSPVDRYLMGIPEAMSEYAGAISFHFALPLLKRRVKQKTYGVPRPIEGRYHPGDQVVLLDDVISSSKTKIDEIQLVESQGLTVSGVAVLVDRQQGGASELSRHGVDLVSAMRISEIAEFALQRSLITESAYDQAMSELDPREID